MNSKIRRLISYYETERINLVRQIEAELSGTEYPADYRMAHRLEKGLKRVNHQIQILHCLSDKSYSEKQRLTDMLAGLVEVSDREQSVSGKEFLAEMMLEKQMQLRELEEQKPGPHRKTTALRDTLVKLMNQEIAGFEFVVSRADGLSCFARLARRTIILTLPQLRKLRKDNILRKKARSRLQSLGFVYYDNKDKMLLFLPFADTDDVQCVWKIFLKMVFEIFYYKEFGPEAEIRYFEA